MRSRIPLLVKLLYSAFLATLVPTYWLTYGPQNFLFFCDVTAVVTGVGLWLESPLLLGTQAVAILVPQAVWVGDFVTGGRLLGLTGYMFNPAYPRAVQAISLFHGWLPFLLVWAIRRVGYDRRAVRYQTAMGVLLLVVCYAAFAPPGATGTRRKVANINYVYGPSDRHPQAWVPQWAWLSILLVGMPAVVFWPTRAVLTKTMPRTES